MRVTQGQTPKERRDREEEHGTHPQRSQLGLAGLGPMAQRRSQC